MDPKFQQSSFKDVICDFILRLVLWSFEFVSNFGFRVPSFRLLGEGFCYQFRNIQHFDPALLLFSKSCCSQLQIRLTGGTG